MKKHVITQLPISELIVNPSNPRLIKDSNFRLLLKSLVDCPDLFNSRPCICSNRTGKNIILGGNMRYLAAKELNYKTVPTIVLSGLTEAQEKEITIKDNGNFGEWNFDVLANEWGNLPLENWGIEELIALKGGDVEKIEQQKVELRPFKKVHFLISAEMSAVCDILEALEEIKKTIGVEIEQSSN